MFKTIKHFTAVFVAASFSLVANHTFANTSTLTQPLSFTGNLATFSDIVAAGYTSFNDIFLLTNPVSSRGASVVSSFNGTIFSTSFSSFKLIDLSNNNSIVATGTISSGYVAQLGFSGLSANSIYGLNQIFTV